jgi:zinc protease
LPSTLPLLEELLKRASFPEHEFKTYIQNKRQKFLVDETKVATIARKKFTQILFGDAHPYGHYLVESEFEGINRNLFADFHGKAYTPDKCHIVVSGKMDPRLDDLLGTHFGGADWKATAALVSVKAKIITDTQRIHYVERKDAVQNAIRIGRMLFNKTHSDYMGMQVLNTLLGGYFGSRLMSNIREDKGYTYGIGSGVVGLKQAGYFFISTEVGVAVCKDALKEIYIELARLRDEPVSVEELDLVKNYMLGTFLRSADGPFALADKFKGLYDYNLDYSYYKKYVQTIKAITPAELQALANKYLRQEDLFELVVGKM